MEEPLPSAALAASTSDKRLSDALAESSDEARLEAARAASQESYLEDAFAAAVAILDSPEWLVTISSFIDVECLIFSDMMTVNEASHVAVFERFRQTVDEFLQDAMQQHNVDLQLLVHICCLATLSPRGHQALEQLLVVEDFKMFASMMVRCNKRLHDKARAAQLSGGGSSGSDGSSSGQSTHATGAMSAATDDHIDGGAGVGITFRKLVRIRFPAQAHSLNM